MKRLLQRPGGSLTGLLPIGKSNPRVLKHRGRRALCLLALAGAMWTSLGVNLSAQVSLGDALDAPTFNWTTSSNLPWSSQDVVMHDNEDAVMTGTVRNNQECWIRTTVTGPGMVRFYWKVSSEADFDVLYYRVGGTNFAEISGEVDWELVELPVAAGNHTLEWIYTKDEDVADGEDAAWLDEFSFTPGPTPPFIYKQPPSPNVNAGVALILEAGVVGATPLTYQWRFNGTNLPNGNQERLVFTSVSTNDTGLYQLIVSNQFGAVTSAVATLLVTLDPLAAALNSPQLLFETGGEALWFPQTSVTHDGVSAAQSGAITDSETSQLRVWLRGPGQLAFWWKVSSEDGFDFLHFVLDSVPAASISGTNAGWQRQTYDIPPGPVLVEWIYEKDSGHSEGLDAGWVDEIVFTPAAPLQATSPMLANGVFSVRVTTKAGKNYALEYKDSLSTANWTALPTVAGDGTVKVLSDPAATTPRRFYRIKEF
jgi:hypothetical protein